MCIQPRCVFKQGPEGPVLQSVSARWDNGSVASLDRPAQSHCGFH